MIDYPEKNTNQQTISKPLLINGIGLHSGEKVTIKLIPANIDYGIRFVRTDVSRNNVIHAIWSNVSNTQLSTTISNNFGVSVSTVEHLMSALSGLHIDNIRIEVDGPEVPIMDGSSKNFVELIDQISLKNQNKKRKIIKIKKKIKVKKDDSSIELSPNNQFSIDFQIDFPSPLISKQSCQLQLVNGNYKTDIASARTFGFEKDVDKLRSIGLALGGSLNNAVVVGESKILNSDGLRFKDEFVRHKILDSIGDLYLAGAPIQGYFNGNKSGHYLNNLLLKTLFSNSKNYEYI
tara:strand:- start:3082 stop:3954 length:873 start_codon:yes stop_codon:yes gene_type:complete